MLDCELLSKVYVNLLDQKEPIFQFKNEINKKSKIDEEKIIYSKKIISLTKKELEEHNEFLKKDLKKNFY